jgi:tetratricopeptide (TPR) repeat protein
MADELDLDELRSHTLSTLGFARVMTGDLDGLHDLRRSVDLAAVAKSPQAARGLNLLASVTAELGDLPQAFELYGESRRVAERFGDAPVLRWLDVEAMYERYWRGDWDGAVEIGAGLAAESTDGGGPQHELDVLLIGAKIALARRGPEQALEDAERALQLARGVGAPQILLPALAFVAHALAAAGRADEGARAADELVRLWLDEGRGLSLASFWLADLAFALAELDRAVELAGAAARARTHTRWLDAAGAVAQGDWPRAAGVFAGIGSLPDEALARAKAAAVLEAAGRSAEAGEQLRRATAFFADVGAAAQAHAPAK